MELVKVIEKKYNFRNELDERQHTNRIILHHTGADLDASAEWVHRVHLDAGYSGIGYHFVIRENGAIERGRPIWAIGAHAYGHNHDSLGIHLSGEFTNHAPTIQQIEACAMLIADLSADFDIPLDGKHILGHRQVNATDCPGDKCFEMLPVIIGKANWYRYE